MSRWNIGTRIAAIIGILALAAFLLTGFLITRQVSILQQQQGEQWLRSESVALASVVERRFNEAPMFTRSVVSMILAEIESGNPSRDRLNVIVRESLRPHRQFIGSTPTFEPNAFDGRDAEFANTALHDSTGRVLPYWYFVEGGDLEAAAVTGLDDPAMNHWYEMPKRLRREYLTEPYVYTVDGVGVLMTSFMTPILRDGEFLGVVSADFALSDWQEKLSQITIGESGRARLISHQGTLLADPDPSLVGKPFVAQFLPDMLRTIQSGQVFVGTYGDRLHVFAPIRTGEAGAIFALGTEMHLDELGAAGRAIGRTITWIATLSSLILIGVVVWLLQRLLGRPLGDVVTAVEAVAAGRFDNAIEIHRNDEVGRVANSLKKMQTDLRDRITAERYAAEENLRVRTALDAASVGMIITDPSFNIVYVNPAAAGIIKSQSAQASLQVRHDEKLVGSSIERFHPATELLTRGTSEILLGEVYLAVNASIVRSADGDTLGHVIEWRDRTSEVQTEHEVGRVVESAAKGCLQERVSLEGKRGFFLHLANALNSLLEAVESSIHEVQGVLAALADGDLTKRSTVNLQGVFSEMRDDANTAMTQLAEVLRDIQQAAAAINTASSEISAGNIDLSRRTEQQAANLEETAASMEELTSTVRQNAESAQAATALARGAEEVAMAGGLLVDGVVSTMSRIEHSSKRIKDIIGTIDGIAFQTNILALNAAVEAARAGDQGRGFAVVASEIRALAQRSAAAAREIKELIEASVAQVGEGSSQVTSAGATMKDIVLSVQRVTNIMAEISTASREQSSGIEQVNLTITQMDEATQQNAALVEEASAAASSMEDQARGLVSSVNRFQLPS